MFGTEIKKGLQAMFGLKRGPGSFIGRVLISGLESVVVNNPDSDLARDHKCFQALEIGCMYQKIEGFSTLKIVQFLSAHCKEFKFISVEYNQAHIQLAKSIISDIDEKFIESIDFRCGASFEILQDNKIINKNTPLDFVFLDGGAHPEICLKEFEIVIGNLSKNGLVIMDDLQQISPVEAYNAMRYFGKGTLVLPLLVINEYLQHRDKFLYTYGSNILEQQAKTIPNSNGLRETDFIEKCISSELTDAISADCGFTIVNEGPHEMLVYGKREVLNTFLSILESRFTLKMKIGMRIYSALKLLLKGRL